MFEEELSIEINRLTAKLDKQTKYSYSKLVNLLDTESSYSDLIKADAAFSNFKFILSIENLEFIDKDSFHSEIFIKKLHNIFFDYVNLDNRYVEKLISNIVELRFNFALKPVSTFLSQVFSDSYTISNQEFLLKSELVKSNSAIGKALDKLVDIINSNSSKYNYVTKPYVSNQLYELLKNEFDNIIYHQNLCSDLFIFLEEFNLSNLKIPSLMLIYDDLKLYNIVSALSNLKQPVNNFTIDDLSFVIEQISNDEFHELKPNVIEFDELDYEVDVSDLEQEESYLRSDLNYQGTTESSEIDENDHISEYNPLDVTLIDNDVKHEDNFDFKSRLQNIAKVLEEKIK